MKKDKRTEKEIISEYMSKLAKKSQKKTPRTKKFLRKIGKMGAIKRWNLSTDDDLQGS